MYVFAYAHVEIDRDIYIYIYASPAYCKITWDKCYYAWEEAEVFYSGWFDTKGPTLNWPR